MLRTNKNKTYIIINLISFCQMIIYQILNIDVWLTESWDTLYISVHYSHSVGEL